MDKTANAVLVIVEGNKSVTVPSLAENLGAVKGIDGVDTCKLYHIYYPLSRKNQTAKAVW